jgi:hypothetical protein
MDASIEYFVRRTLGCRCPPEVFQSVSIERQHLETNGTTYARLVIGHRLLIYVTEPAGGPSAARLVSDLTLQGCAERDANAWNRFRLVIAMDAATDEAAGLAERFAATIGADDRAHLHVVSPAQIPAAARP